MDCLLDKLELRSRQPDNDQPARSLIEVFCSRANVVIVEGGYFDIDYRSEFSKVHDSRFAFRSPDTTRLHFFHGVIADDNPYIYDFVAQDESIYYGYTVIRPQVPGKIGRSMVSVDVEVPGIIGEKEFADKVRTSVAEVVQVFGVAKKVVGVPFMEQDGHILTCAHIAAWVCHYTAVLRGAVRRRATAEFHDVGDKSAAVSRPYPSQGLNLNVVATTLRSVDLPPEVLDAASLLRYGDTNWSRRPGFSARLNELTNAESEEERNINSRPLARLWVRENLGATICRYLNSKLPVILLRSPEDNLDVAHAQVVVGYLRRSEIDEDALLPRRLPPQQKSDSDVTAFIVCDDQVGPYKIVLLDDLVDAIMSSIYSEDADTAVVVPLPRSLWLSGTAAEEAATYWLETLAQDRLDRLPTWQAITEDERSGVYHDNLRSFVAQVSGSEVGQLALRSYVSTGVEFKKSFTERLGGSIELARAIGNMQLPKYVWVCEAIVRSLRSVRGGKSVLATIVFDSTAVAIEGRMTGADLIPLIVHLPGQAKCASRYADYRSSPGQNGIDDYQALIGQDWIPACTGLYKTGRWNRASHNTPDVYQPWKVALSTN
ncbi:hypothetical protein [Nocardia tenerifensis]|uniref:hypothetical protein n=1 Tax=Nocardia tenerifensis TaxID=228006 RepID=UPI0011B521CA|nr:hypothetical protein [Nocardia tenerifensis]